MGQRMAARAGDLPSGRGCNVIESGLEVPPARVSGRLSSLRDRRCCAARSRAAPLCEGRPCAVYGAAHSLDRRPRNLRRASSRRTLRTEQTPPQPGHRPCPASDAQACHVPRAGRDGGSMGEEERKGISFIDLDGSGPPPPSTCSNPRPVRFQSPRRPDARKALAERKLKLAWVPI